MVELRIGHDFNGYFVNAKKGNYLFYDGKYKIGDCFDIINKFGIDERKRQVYYHDMASAELAIKEYRRQEKMDELKKIEAEIERLKALKKKLTQTFRIGQWFKSYSEKKYHLVQTGYHEFNLVGGNGNTPTDPIAGANSWSITWDQINKMKTGLTPINVNIAEVD